jgi:hypothetical protein
MADDRSTGDAESVTPRSLVTIPVLAGDRPDIMVE